LVQDTALQAREPGDATQVENAPPEFYYRRHGTLLKNEVHMRDCKAAVMAAARP